MSHLDQNGLLSHFQCGFRRNRSTELAVTHFTDAIRIQAERANLTGCVFIDLSKGFDTISHAGIHGIELELELITFSLDHSPSNRQVYYLKQNQFLQGYHREATWVPLYL